VGLAAYFLVSWSESVTTARRFDAASASLVA
jgi:hypothetical protein